MLNEFLKGVLYAELKRKVETGKNGEHGSQEPFYRTLMTR